jgi:hypothetical protein
MSENYIKIGKAVVRGDVLSWKGNEYKLNDIRHLYFGWVQYKRKYVGMSDDQAWNNGAKMKLELELKNNEKITLKAGTFFSHTAKKFEDFYKGYSYISEKTIVNRLNGYIEEVNRDGYFTYAKARFFIDGKIEMKGLFRNISMDIKNSVISRTASDVVIKPKLKGDEPVFTTIMTKLGLKTYLIPTSCDRDVFFYLLKKFYDVYWE